MSNKNVVYIAPRKFMECDIKVLEDAMTLYMNVKGVDLTDLRAIVKAFKNPTVSVGGAYVPDRKFLDYSELIKWCADDNPIFNEAGELVVNTAALPAAKLYVSMDKVRMAVLKQEGTWKC